ncbi:hypothetical protein DPMN_039139 [Dreissena polymorpha]|uniref:Uncharacterized protein n=1 Tax=Dreissena polymorpha TaxID=45954 RepID=A0A9D4MHN3_DREPO|nr:hypothetical protein DPMN_039139 [Dreissena polymorpha]
MSLGLLLSDESGRIDESDVALLSIVRRMNEILRDVGLRMIMGGSRVMNLQDVLYRMLK